MDYLSIFEHEVTDDIAPGYSDEIDQPICLQDIDSKVQNEEYDGIKDLNEDVDLMLQNCIKYNGETSDLGQVRASKIK